MPATAVPETLTDEEVVARVVEGDTALFEILVRRHNTRVYRAVRAVLRDDGDAEDVMQEAYLHAYRGLRAFEGRAQFSTWLTRIAVNAALARRGKPNRNGDDTMLTLVEAEGPDPEQQTLTSELRTVMEREVAALPDTFREVIILRDVEGLSTAEAATCLAISEDLVKTRLHRARALLRDRLYRRSSLGALFTFGNERCDRVVSAVMARLSAARIEN
jgi:RNA polymerase sigma-70 factor (ECF subfamily)